jgi:hypothetical protein
LHDEPIVVKDDNYFPAPEQPTSPAASAGAGAKGNFNGKLCVIKMSVFLICWGEAVVFHRLRRNFQ